MACINCLGICLFLCTFVCRPVSFLVYAYACMCLSVCHIICHLLSATFSHYHYNVRTYCMYVRTYCMYVRMLFCIYCSPPSVVTPKTKRKYLTSDSGCDHDKTTRSTSYIMNDRLFPVPLHEFEDDTHCPVCEGSNRPDEEEEPTRFIRWVNGVPHYCTVYVPRVTQPF